MDADGTNPMDALARLPQRLMALIELMTSLDTRVASALDAIDQMRTSVTAFDPAREDIEQLVADIRGRLARAEERIDADLDEIKTAVLAKLGDLDVTALGPRLNRLEQAVFNIERATINMDRTLEGGVGLLPDFMTRKVRAEGKREAPAFTPEADGA